MCRITKVFLLLFIHRYFGNCFLVSISPPQVLLSVYYESKDDASKDFILNTLVPAVLYLQESITLQMVPFGAAKSFNYGTDGFQCRRGPSECYGNMVHDCALNVMHRRSNLEKVTYIACEMKYKAATKRKPQCLLDYGVSEEDVSVCITSKHGIQLQLSSEYLTKLAKPKTIPLVTINGEIQHFQSGSNKLEELLTNICAKMQDTKICSRFFNNLALKQILNTPIKLN